MKKKERDEDHVCVVMCPSNELRRCGFPRALKCVSDDHFVLPLRTLTKTLVRDIDDMCLCVTAGGSCWPCFVSVPVLFSDSPVVVTSPGCSCFKN